MECRRGVIGVSLTGVLGISYSKPGCSYNRCRKVLLRMEDLCIFAILFLQEVTFCVIMVYISEIILNNLI